MKKKILILYIAAAVLAVAALGLPAASMFLFCVPAFVLILCAVLAVGCAACCAVIAEKKKPHIITSGVMAAVMAAGVLFGFFWNPYANSVIMRNCGFTEDYAAALSQKQAQSDIRQAYALLKRIHPAFLGGEPESVRLAYENALASVPENGMTCAELRRQIAAICSPLGDAHTCVGVFPRAERYPADYAELIKGGGYTITAVNGMPLAEFLSENSELFSFEAESWGMHSLKNNLVSDTGLNFLGLGTEVTLTYERGGERLERVYTDADFLGYEEYMERNGSYYEDKGDSFVRYELFPESGYALLTIDSCTYNSEYRDTIAALFNELSASGIDRLVIDLRKNSGGDDRCAWEVINYLGTDSFRAVSYRRRLGPLLTPKTGGEWKTAPAEPAFRGDVAVLTSEQSFSSAMLFALYFKDNALGTVVGEIPGNAANSFGDITMFRLSNSGLLLSLSTKEFFRADQNAGDFVLPDIICPANEALDTALSAIGV